jgi:putative ABC transport system ATP-binding protein
MVAAPQSFRPSFSLMPILSLQNVTKDYFTDGQPVRALNNLSLEVSSGQFVALVGRSGCGKSTLLSLAGAMDFPSSGVVLVDGVATKSLRDDALARVRREKIGFIFQSFQLIHTLTAFGAAAAAGGREERERESARAAFMGRAGRT